MFCPRTWLKKKFGAFERGSKLERQGSKFGTLPSSQAGTQLFQPITTHCRILSHWRYIAAVDNIVRKGEIACNKQFLLFAQCFFFTLNGTYFSIKINLKLLSPICFNFDQSKILSSGNGFSIKRDQQYCAIVTTRSNPYLHQTPSVLRRSPLELLSVTCLILLE